MRFEPKTEKQIAEEGLIPKDTICDFEVLEAVEKTSRAGNDMIELKIKVWRPDGTTLVMRDWLVSNFLPKVIGFANATGMRAAYDAGLMHAADMSGRSGKLKMGVQDATNDYPAQNKVASYVKADQRSSAPPPPLRQPVAAAVDDDIPF